MRVVNLTNANNEQIDLNSSGLFASTLDGLGVTFGREYNKSNGNFRLIKTEQELSSMQSNVYLSIEGFKESTMYARLVSFLRFPPFRFEYSDGGDTMMRLCMLKSLAKNERKSGNPLENAIELDFITPWYRKKNYFDASTQATVQASGFMLPVVFPFTFGTLESDKKSAFNIRNNSTYLVNQRTRMSPVKVKITAKNADVVNPYWEVFANSERVSSDGYDITIPIGWTLEVSSLFQERTALLIDPDGKKSSVYQQQHMERGGFVHVPIGESTIVFHVQGEQVSCDVYEEVDLF